MPDREVLNIDLWAEIREKHALPPNKVNKTAIFTEVDTSNPFMGANHSQKLVADYENDDDLIPAVEAMMIEDERFIELYSLIIKLKVSSPEYVIQLDAIAKYVYLIVPVVYTFAVEAPIPDDDQRLSALRSISPNDIPEPFISIAGLVIVTYANQHSQFLNMAEKVMDYIKQL